MEEFISAVFVIMIITLPAVIVIGEAYAKWLAARNLDDLAKGKFFEYEYPPSIYIGFSFKDDFIVGKSVKGMRSSKNKDFRKLFYTVIFVRCYSVCSIILIVTTLIISRLLGI